MHGEEIKTLLSSIVKRPLFMALDSSTIFEMASRVGDASEARHLVKVAKRTTKGYGRFWWFACAQEGRSFPDHSEGLVT